MLFDCFFRKVIKTIVLTGNSWYINKELQQGVGHAHSIIMSVIMLKKERRSGKYQEYRDGD